MALKIDEEEIAERECWRLVKLFFKGDIQRTWLWFETENPLLGGVTPDGMILMGKSIKLEKFIRSMMHQNGPSEEIYNMILGLLQNRDKVHLWWFAHNEHLQGIPADIYLEPDGEAKIINYLQFFLEK